MMGLREFLRNADSSTIENVHLVCAIFIRNICNELSVYPLPGPDDFKAILTRVSHRIAEGIQRKDMALALEIAEAPNLEEVDKILRIERIRNAGAGEKKELDIEAREMQMPKEQLKALRVQRVRDGLLGG